MNAANRAPSGGFVQQISDEKRRKAKASLDRRKALQKGNFEERRDVRRTIQPTRFGAIASHFTEDMTARLSQMSLNCLWIETITNSVRCHR